MHLAARAAEVQGPSHLGPYSSKASRVRTCGQPELRGAWYGVEARPVGYFELSRRGELDAECGREPLRLCGMAYVSIR
jgi:hypothetical protein